MTLRVALLSSLVTAVIMFVVLGGGGRERSEVSQPLVAPAAGDDTYLPPMAPPALDSEAHTRPVVDQPDRHDATSSPPENSHPAATIFPTWPAYLNHYMWQVRTHIRINHARGSAHVALRRQYVDLFERFLTQGYRQPGLEPRDPLLNALFPVVGESMISIRALNNVRHLLQRAKLARLSGNFLEAGVWRGGTPLYARMIQKYFLDPSSDVFVCDSFQGLPKIREAVHREMDRLWHILTYLAVPLERVQDLFRAHDLLDPTHVHFFRGFFVHSMPLVREHLLARNKTLSVLRADGDMYESTIDILYRLYDLVEVGGYVIIDDWSWGVNKFGARSAAMDFRRVHGIEDDAHGMVDVDGSVAFWRKARDVPVQRHRYPKQVFPDPPISPAEYNQTRDRWDALRPTLWNDANLW